MFRNKGKLIDDSNLNIIIDDINIEQVDSCKFLGVIINSKLTWQDHIKTV